ncbi:MAG: hypothetical protein NZM29_05360 [Nitrospira sp.]|nr:hypothetical protein [Nitrospira sp.]
MRAGHAPARDAGAYSGFGDGSVRLFRDTADPVLVRWIAGRNDGVVVPIDF